MPAGDEPITDDEILFRRIPESTGWFDPQTKSTSPQAFKPTASDTDGLSLSRAKYGTPEQAAAHGRRGKTYWIAKIVAKSITDAGIVVLPDPIQGDPGHARIPAMHFGARRETNVLEWMLALSKLCVEVEGPHPGHFDPPAKDATVG